MAQDSGVGGLASAEVGDSISLHVTRKTVCSYWSKSQYALF